MEIFNLFIRRFLTIKFNDAVINKSGKNSLIPWEFFSRFRFRFYVARPQFWCRNFAWKQGDFCKREMLNLIKSHKYFLWSLVSVKANKRVLNKICLCWIEVYLMLTAHGKSSKKITNKLTTFEILCLSACTFLVAET